MFVPRAEFLRSESLSCTRALSPGSCSTDPTLSARSYFSDLRLMKVNVCAVARVRARNWRLTVAAVIADSSRGSSTSVRLSRKSLVVSDGGEGPVCVCSVCPDVVSDPSDSAV